MPAPEPFNLGDPNTWLKLPEAVVASGPQQPGEVGTPAMPPQELTGTQGLGALVHPPTQQQVLDAQAAVQSGTATDNQSALSQLAAAGAPTDAAGIAALQALGAAGATGADAAALRTLGSAQQASNAATGASDIQSILGPNMPAGLAQEALDWANAEMLKPNMTAAQMENDLYTHQPGWFKTAFPGIVQQLKNGQTPMTPADYLAFKQNVTDFNNQFGIPQGFVNDAEFGDMVGRGWTFQDYTNRMGLAFSNSAQAVANNPQAASLLDQWYGIKPGSGALAAFYLDPDKTQQLLAQATTAAQAGAAAQTAGYQPIDQKTLMSLATNHSLSELQSGINAGVGLLPTQRAELGQGKMLDTLRPQDILAAQLGGIPGGETAEQAQNRVNEVVGQRTAGTRGGGGFQGAGATGKGGAGYASQ